MAATEHSGGALDNVLDLTFDTPPLATETDVASAGYATRTIAPVLSHVHESPRPHGRVVPPSLKRRRQQQLEQGLGHSQGQSPVAAALGKRVLLAVDVVDLVSSEDDERDDERDSAHDNTTGKRTRAPLSLSLDTPEERQVHGAARSPSLSSPLSPSSSFDSSPPLLRRGIGRKTAGAGAAAGVVALGASAAVLPAPGDIHSAAESVRGSTELPFAGTSRAAAAELASCIGLRGAFADAISGRLASQLTAGGAARYDWPCFDNVAEQLTALTYKTNGRYGAVVLACLAQVGAHARAGAGAEDSTGLENTRPCWNVTIDRGSEVGDDGRRVVHPASVVMKLAPFYDVHVRDLDLAAAIASDDRADVTGTLLGLVQSKNHPVREAVIARLLTKLVRARAVPHVPLLYGAAFVCKLPSPDAQLTQVNVDAVRSFVRSRGRDAEGQSEASHTSDAGDADAERSTRSNGPTSPGMVLFSEVIDLTLSDVSRLLLTAGVASAVVDSVLRVLLMQVFVTLEILYRAARFRHHDLHRNNVMVAFTTPSAAPVMYELADGTIVALPNIGLSARIIDFGLSSTEVLPLPVVRAIGAATAARGSRSKEALMAEAGVAYDQNMAACGVVGPVSRFQYLHSTYQCQAVLGDVVHFLSGLEAVMFAAADAWHVLRDTYLTQIGDGSGGAARSACPPALRVGQIAPPQTGVHTEGGSATATADRPPKTLPQGAVKRMIPLQSSVPLGRHELDLTRFVAHMARSWGFVGTASTHASGGSTCAAAGMAATGTAFCDDASTVFGRCLPHALAVDEADVLDVALYEHIVARNVCLEANVLR